MPKQKTHKGMKKRFKVTATGKIKHKSAYRGHILSSKSPSGNAACAKTTLSWVPKPRLSEWAWPPDCNPQVRQALV